ncbi:MAG: hypothetical protein Q9209_003864 [Squamulea sp. 1 TL-2023]
MCRSGFKEAKAGTVDLKEENPSIINKLVQYLYNCDYSEPDDVETGHGTGKLAFNATMYTIGDRYLLNGLKDLAKAKFAAALPDGWNKESLPDVIRFIYENTLSDDRGLRECLVPILSHHKTSLRSDDAFMDVVKNYGEFAVDVIDAWTKPNPQDSPETFLQCDCCNYLYPSNYTGSCIVIHERRTYGSAMRTVHMAI